GWVGDIADAGAGRRRWRHIDIAARAEADEAVALAAREAVTRLDVAKNSTRDQPGDLDAGDINAGRRLQMQRVALVVERCLVERCVHESTLVVPGVDNNPIDGTAVRM